MRTQVFGRWAKKGNNGRLVARQLIRQRRKSRNILAGQSVMPSPLVDVHGCNCDAWCLAHVWEPQATFLLFFFFLSFLRRALFSLSGAECAGLVRLSSLASVPRYLG